ncbi:MAG: TonB-dependent receptor [Solimonas sp.]
MHRSIRSAVPAVFCGTLLLAPPAHAQAAEPSRATEAGPAPAAESGQLAEVIVTAEKREASLQDTPISAVAFGADQLEALGIDDIGDLGSKVPNLQLTPHPNSATTPRVFIRGVGNFDDQITQDPSVAIYIDGVYVGRSQGMGTEVADLERIEVLRGPQGTLYGRNATGGAINFVTAVPQLGAWGFDQKLTFGSRDEFRSRSLLNLPFGDTVAARLSYAKAEQDGFVDNRGSGEKTFGAEDRDALRGDLLWQPDGQWSWRYTFDRSTIDDSPFYLQPSPAGQAPHRSRQSNPAVDDLQPDDIVTIGHNLSGSWTPAAGMTIKSITGYRKLDSFVYQDYLSGQFGPTAALITENDVTQDQFSEELQWLGSAFDGGLDYIVGLYYFRESADGLTASVLPASGVTAYSGTGIRNTAYAAYVQGTYTPPWRDRRLHLTVGGRWSRDEREATLANRTLLANGTTVPGGQGAGDKDFDNFSPSATLGYDFSERIKAYAKYAEGYKTGGYNIRASSIAAFEQGFGPETLDSYELGLKSEWLQRRLRVNAAVFRADYRDIQINAQSDLADPTKADILNAGKATIEGVELDGTALLARGLLLTLSYAYLDAGYDRIVDGRGADVTGNYAFVNAPRNSYTAALGWDVAATCIGLLHADLDYSWQDDKVSTASTVNGVYKIDAYGLLNARIALSAIPGAPAGSFEFAVWGRNLTDKEYSVIYAPLFGGYRAWGEPRTVGVDLRYRF